VIFVRTHGRYAPWDLLEMPLARRHFIEQTYAYVLEKEQEEREAAG
jgi:hypothetical protein